MIPSAGRCASAPVSGTVGENDMSNDIVVNAKTREDTGSASMGRLRRSGWIPAIVYGAGHASVMLQLNEHDFEMMLSRHASEAMMLSLVIDGGAPEKVLLKAVQHHPVNGHPIHVDFQAVDMKSKLHVDIPLELVGEPIGAAKGGVLEHLLRSVEVACFPDDLVEMFEIDVRGLDIGDTLTVADIAVDRDRYEILTDAGIAVTAVAAPRVAEEVEAGAEEAGEPEVISTRARDED